MRFKILNSGDVHGPPSLFMLLLLVCMCMDSRMSSLFLFCWCSSNTKSSSENRWFSSNVCSAIALRCGVLFSVHFKCSLALTLNSLFVWPTYTVLHSGQVARYTPGFSVFGMRSFVDATNWQLVIAGFLLYFLRRHTHSHFRSILIYLCAMACSIPLKRVSALRTMTTM